MSYFAEHMTVEKKVVITYFGKKYVTAIGVVGMLADRAAEHIIERETARRWKSSKQIGRRQRDTKYGKPTYSDLKALELWKAHKSRLRKKFTRRALPIIERLFA